MFFYDQVLGCPFTFCLEAGNSYILVLLMDGPKHNCLIEPKFFVFHGTLLVCLAYNKFPFIIEIPREVRMHLLIKPQMQIRDLKTLTIFVQLSNETIMILSICLNHVSFCLEHRRFHDLKFLLDCFAIIFVLHKSCRFRHIKEVRCLHLMELD